MDTTTRPEGQDDLIAHAIDRVLHAERAAQTSVADCEARNSELLEQARQQRRMLLERARARIVSLHTRAARAIELRQLQLQDQSRRTAEQSAARLEDRTPMQAALARLAQRLTSSEPE